MPEPCPPVELDGSRAVSLEDGQLVKRYFQGPGDRLNLRCFGTVAPSQDRVNAFVVVRVEVLVSVQVERDQVVISQENRRSFLAAFPRLNLCMIQHFAVGRSSQDFFERLCARGPQPNMKKNLF
jgi:hypothetical protein